MVPKVSIIITAYNSEKYLGQALASVEAQKFRNFELIVVDDGSKTREAATICNAFTESSGIPVRYIYQENNGPSSARNHGLKVASCNYIAFLDVDDLFKPSKLLIQVSLLNDLPENYACVIGCAEVFNDGESESLGRACPDAVDGRLDCNSFLRGDVRIEGTPAYYLFRRSALLNIGGYDENLRNNEDFDLLFRLGRVYSLKTHSDVVFSQRLRPDSLSKGDPIKGLCEVLRFTDKVERTYPDVAGESVGRKRQRAYFVAAKASLKKNEFRQYIWLANQGFVKGGKIQSIKGGLVYLSVRWLRFLGEKPKGVGDGEI